MNTGFTGTSQGMSDDQKAAVKNYLIDNFGGSFHHGDCVGADAEASEIAAELGLWIVVHPPENESKRAFCQKVRVILPPKPYLERNRDIVNSCDRLIATPLEGGEILRSGTWATVRYARKVGKPVTIIYRDGTIIHEDNRDT